MPIITHFNWREPARGGGVVFSFRLPADQRSSILGQRERCTPLLTHGEHTRILEDSTMWRSTIGLLVTFGISLLMVPRATDAQQPVKVPLIGILGAGLYPSEAQRQQSPFLQKLRELGWHEG